MKNLILSSFLVATIAGFAMHAVPARADVDNPSVDELAETKLDAEVEADDNQEIKFDNQFAGEQDKAMKRELVEAQKEADSLRGKNERAKKQLEEKWNRVNAAKAKLQEAQTKLAKIQDELNGHKQELDRAQTELENLNDQKQSLKSSIAQINRENVKLAREIRIAKRKTSVATTQLKWLRHRRQELSAQNRNLRSKSHFRRHKQVALRLSKTRLANNSDD